MNLDTSFWKSRSVFWGASLLLALLIFFSTYDFAWRPHQSLQAALCYSALAPLILASGAAMSWCIGRLFRVPVEWDFLLRLHVWISLVAAPLYLLDIVCERNFVLWESGRSLSTFTSGILIALWSFQILRRYQTRANPALVWTFCSIVTLLSAGSAIASQRGPKMQVAGAHPWRWQISGRIRLAYTDDNSTPEAARRDARNADEMLRRVEQNLGVPSRQTPVNVFLFPSEYDLAEFTEDDTLAGVAGLSGVLIPGDEWEWMRGTLAHELCHFVIAREFGPNVRALPDEGTAVWMENKLAPAPAELDEIALSPQRQKNFVTAKLANNSDFYEQDEASLAASYRQAGWLAQTTIQKHGLPKWSQFLRVCQSGFWSNLSEKSPDASAQVKAQYQKVFGEPMP